MKKLLNPVIKKKTSTDIYDGIVELSIDDNPEFLTITNIAERSGYSIGNIYHYFKNIDNLIDEFVVQHQKKRVAVVIKVINETPASMTAKEFIKHLNDLNFKFMTKLPRAITLKLASTVMTKSDVLKRIDENNKLLVDPLEAMIKANKTNTFKKLTYREIEIAILVYASAVRKPVTDNHKLAFTKSHQQQSLAILMALFAN
ncbi:DNA-binding HTH domain, TetR-type [Methylophilaceae bacterium]